MTERLAKGQNVVWTASTCVVRVEAAVPIDISVLLLGADGRVSKDADFVFYNNPSGPGVVLGSGGDITLTLPAVQAVSVMCLISVDPQAQPLGSSRAPRALLSGPDQLQELEFIIAGLTTERAVLTFELYRRGQQWKVRAIGQGYTGGLAAAVADHGVDVEPEVAPAPALTPTPPHLVAPAPPGTTDQERLHRVIGSIFEDAARSTAGMRAATGFAKRRRDSELSEALADPSTRNTPAGAAAAQQVEQRYQKLMDQAQTDHRRDVLQLLSELKELELKLPASMLDWSAAAWRNWQPPVEPNLAIRAGSLTVPEAPDLRMPLMVGVPLGRPLWIDSAGGLNSREPESTDPAEFFIPDTPEELFASVTSRVDPLAMARALITRILATAPAGGIKLMMADLAGRGSAAQALKPLGAVGCRVFDAPVATTPEELGVMLDDCVNLVDLGQMALQGGVSGPDSGRLLVITNFPYGLDDAQIGKLRFLVDEGPTVGLGLILIGDHSEAEGRGAMVTSLFRSFMRLPVEPDNHLGDAWTGTTWTFTPDAGPVDQQIQTAVLARISGQS